MTKWDMNWIDLGNPSPRKRIKSYVPYEWRIKETEFLLEPADISTPAFDTTINRRRTKYNFGELSRNQLTNFLWLSSRTINKKSTFNGQELEQRPSPSAGAIHPIHILISSKENVWSKYNSSQHSLLKLKLEKENLFNHTIAINELIEIENALTIFFVAEPGKTFSKYKSAGSLVWRDTGVLIGYMSLVAEALNLNFCPLGITGDNWSKKLDPKRKLFGVGVALLGSR